MYKVFYNLLAGFCMGLAEITPGISGATIAGIFNVYKGFLASLSSFNPQLLKKGFRQFIANLNLSFMAPLLIGMSVAIVLAANVINYLIVTLKPIDMPPIGTTHSKKHTGSRPLQK